jgi:hypothetical protein
MGKKFQFVEPNYLARVRLLQKPTKESGVWRSMVDEDKGTVREIEFQAIGGCSSSGS